MSDSRSTGPSLRQSLGLDRHPLTRAKYFALGAAILMMILGVVIALTTNRPPPPSTERTSSSRAQSDNSRPEGGLLGQGFAPTRPSATDGASDSSSGSDENERTEAAGGRMKEDPNEAAQSLRWTSRKVRQAPIPLPPFLCLCTGIDAELPALARQWRQRNTRRRGELHFTPLRNPVR